MNFHLAPDAKLDSGALCLLCLLWSVLLHGYCCVGGQYLTWS